VYYRFAESFGWTPDQVDQVPNKLAQALFELTVAINKKKKETGAI
jgi:hypothetical protein